MHEPNRRLPPARHRAIAPAPDYAVERLAILRTWTVLYRDQDIVSGADHRLRTSSLRAVTPTTILINRLRFHRIHCGKRPSSRSPICSPVCAACGTESRLRRSKRLSASSTGRPAQSQAVMPNCGGVCLAVTGQAFVRIEYRREHSSRGSIRGARLCREAVERALVCCRYSPKTNLVKHRHVGAAAPAPYNQRVALYQL